MTRILFLNHDLTCGGAERALLGLLSNVDRSRFEPELWVRSLDGELRSDYENLGIGIHAVPGAMSEGPRRSLIWKAAVAGARIRLGRFDLIQSFSTNAWWTEAWAARLGGVRGYVIRKSDLYLHGPERSWEVRHSHADRIVAVTEEVFRRFYKGTPLEEKARVIRNGVDTDRFSPKPFEPDSRRKLGIPEGASLFACVASLSPYKGQVQLLVALTVAKGRGLPLHIAFAGRDISDGEVQRMAADLGVKDRAIFLGHRDDIPELLSGCDGLVLVSPREGCSNAVLEAMSCGVPTVVSANGAEELIRDGENGFVVPVGATDLLVDRMTRLAADPALRRHLGDAARQTVLKDFTLSRMARDYELVWEEVLESRPLPSPSPTGGGWRKAGRGQEDRVSLPPPLHLERGSRQAGVRSPRVSVLIPAYNAEPFIDAAVESVRAQTFTDWEIVAVDDASSDATFERLKVWAERDERIHVARNEKNRGVTGNWNECLHRARGEFVVKLDADDVFRPRSLEELLAALSEPGIIGAGMRTLLCSESLEPFGAIPADAAMMEAGIDPYTDTIRDCEQWLRLAAWGHQLWSGDAVLLRRSVLDAVGGLDERFGCASDSVLISRALGHPGRFAHRAYVGILYRMVESSVSHDSRRNDWLKWEGLVLQLLTLSRVARRGLERPLRRRHVQLWLRWKSSFSNGEARRCLPPSMAEKLENASREIERPSVSDVLEWKARMAIESVLSKRPFRRRSREHPLEKRGSVENGLRNS